MLEIGTNLLELIKFVSVVAAFVVITWTVLN